MGDRTALALLAVLVLAGCASEAPPGLPSPSAGEAELAPPPMYGPAVCDNILLFEIVDYAQTDPFLPPGFHARDPQAFVSSPAAFGQAGVIFLALDCDSETSGPLQAAFLGIFIEPPIVEGIDPAPVNFLELVRYNAAPEFGGALAGTGWPVVPADVRMVENLPTGGGRDAQVTVEDAEGAIAMVAGGVATPPGNVGNTTRFWHQDAGGLSYIEYDASLDASVGSGLCQTRPGTPLSVFVGSPLGAGETPAGDLSFSCLGVNGGEPIVVALQGLALNATFHRLPGVQAG